jgi:hypothetical protein
LPERTGGYHENSVQIAENWVKEIQLGFLKYEAGILTT